MSLYARVISGLVHEAPIDLPDGTTPDTLWPDSVASQFVSCGTGVAAGWLYDGKTFSAPPTPSPAPLPIRTATTYQLMRAMTDAMRAAYPRRGGHDLGGSIFRQATANPTITTLTFVQTAKIVTYQGDGSTVAVNGTTISAILGNGLKNSGSAIVVDPAVVVRKFVGTITGDGTTTSFPFTHGLGTASCQVTVRDSSGAQVLVDNTVTGTTATVAFGAAPASNVTYTAVVMG